MFIFHFSFFYKKVYNNIYFKNYMIEVIIILGHKSELGNLSEMARERIAKGVEIYKEKKVKIIMSGGYSLQNRKDSGVIESELMKDYAIKKGIPPKDIILESESRDTQGNAYFTKQIIKSNAWKNILVVTSDFHIPKSKFFFDYIYGEDYKILFSESKTNFFEGELKEIEKKEKRSIDIMKKIYRERKIKRGDDEKVGEELKEFYSKKN